jgi:hypothetical protein
MEWESLHWKVYIIGDRCHKFIKCSCLNWTIQKLHYDTEHKKGPRNYPSRIDLSMHSLQNRCRHSITVRVFRIIPTQLKTYSQEVRFIWYIQSGAAGKRIIGNQCRVQITETNWTLHLLAYIWPTYRDIAVSRKRNHSEPLKYNTQVDATRNPHLYQRQPSSNAVT